MTSRRFIISSCALLSFLTLNAHAILTPAPNPAATDERALQEAVRRAFRVQQDFPFWRNVGLLNDSTAVYMGNGYVLTAAHVGAGVFKLPDGSSYKPEPNSLRRFRNADGTFADLCLFRVIYRKRDPIAKLPSVPMGPMRPPRGSYVLLIGAGSGNSHLHSRNTDFRWNEDYRLRWGLNRVEHEFGEPMRTHHYLTSGFATQFSQGEAECQATPGDSGGPAFVYNHGTRRWELGGIILAVDSEFGRAAFGNQTYIADLRVLPQTLTHNGLIAAN